MMTRVLGDTTSDEETVDENRYNDDVAPVGQDEPALHFGRGYSVGIYGRVPVRPHRIRMTKRVIDSPTASRTLLAIMRVNWPLGCIGTVDVNKRCPKWWQSVYDKFLTYYAHDPAFGTAKQAREAVMFHMRNNMRKILNNERRRVKPLIEEKGGTFLDYRPRYFSDDVWKSFCDYWDSPKFKKKQAAAQKSRRKLANPHTSGATSFERRARELTEILGHEPENFELFLHTHTKRGLSDFTSERVRQIVERYLDICKTNNMEPTSTPINTWVETVGVRKNTITGVPRTKASEVIPSQKATKTSRRREGDKHAGSTTHSNSLNDIFMRVVYQTLSYARANPDTFGLSPDQVNTLVSSMTQGESDLPDDHPLTLTTMRDLVHVMMATLNDIHIHCSNSNKGKTIQLDT